MASAALIFTSCGNKGKSASDSAAQDSAAPTEVQSYVQSHDTPQVAGHPTIIDFSATWCGPCRQIAPYVHEMAEKNQVKVNFRFVDVDEDAETANQYRVDAMPTFVLLDGDGIEQARVVGADQAALDDLLRQALTLAKDSVN